MTEKCPGPHIPGPVVFPLHRKLAWEEHHLRRYDELANCVSNAHMNELGRDIFREPHKCKRGGVG